MTVIPDGGLLAIDWGQKKVGIATCDETGSVVTPRGHFKRNKGSAAWKLNESDIQQLNKLLETWQPGALVLGLPLNPGGKETNSSLKARELAKVLKKQYSLEVMLVDETLTSWASKDTKDDDAHAAAIMLEDWIAQSKRHNNNKGQVRSLLILFLIAISIAAFITKGFFFSAHSNKAEESYIVDIAPRTGFSNLFDQLELNATNRKIAKVWLKVRGLESSLKVGEFEVQPQWSAAKTLEQVLTTAPIYHSLTVREGENVYDIYITLNKVFPNLKMEDYLALIKDPKLLNEMGIPEPRSEKITLEGFLYPETYTYQKYHKPKDLIRHMISQFDKTARAELEKHEWSNTPEGFYNLLTLASIVEKESSDVEEQPVIASVFWNRLKKGMRLQSDPTTIYPLLPDFDGNLKRIHLETKNDYNTYRMNGIPISPIANPGITAIKAVVSPAQTPYLYFVSKNDGTHVFSEDYKTHNSYVQEYQIRRKKKNK